MQACPSRAACFDTDIILQKMRRMEEATRTEFRPRAAYLSFRRDLVDWIGEACDNLHLSTMTSHTAASLMDRFLQCMDVSQRRYQAVAIACILLAAKYEEMEENVPTVDNVYANTRADSAISQLANTRYSEEFVHQMELLILHAFAWNMTCVTPVHFIMHYNNEGIVMPGDTIHNAAPPARVGRYLSKYTTFFADLCMQDFELSTHLPSLLSAAIVLTSRRALAIRPLWTPELAGLTGYQEAELLPVCTSLWSVYTSAFPAEALRQEAVAIKHDQIAARSGLVSIGLLRDMYAKYPIMQAEMPAELRPRPSMPTPSAPGSPADSPPDRLQAGRAGVAASSSSGGPATPSHAGTGSLSSTNSYIIPGFGGTLATASSGAAPAHAHSAAVAGLAAGAATAAAAARGRPLPTSPESLAAPGAAAPAAIDTSFTSTSSGGPLSESALLDTSRGSAGGAPQPGGPAPVAGASGVLMSPVAGLAAVMGPLGLHDSGGSSGYSGYTTLHMLDYQGATPSTVLSSATSAYTVASERSDGAATYLGSSGAGWGSGVGVFAPDASVVRALWGSATGTPVEALDAASALPSSDATPAPPAASGALGAAADRWAALAGAHNNFGALLPATAAAPATKHQHGAAEHQGPSKPGRSAAGLAALPAAQANEMAAGKGTAAAASARDLYSTAI